MSKGLTAVMWLLATAGVAGAQEQAVTAGRGNAAADFSGTSASRVNLFTASESGDSARASGVGEASAAPAATPGAKPKYIFGERDDYRWQLGIGVEFFRFRSNVIDASMVGLNTTLTYYTNSWFAVEGSVITGFAPEIYDREHVKLFGGTGGIRVGGRRARWEPWMHGLVGGSHLQPQTAFGGRNSLMAQVGGGVDFRVYARLSLRAQADWVYTQYFGQTQNNFQGVAGAVLHF
jgi:hypothetical protein